MKTQFNNGAAWVVWLAALAYCGVSLGNCLLTLAEARDSNLADLLMFFHGGMLFLCASLFLWRGGPWLHIALGGEAAWTIMDTTSWLAAVAPMWGNALPNVVGRAAWLCFIIEAIRRARRRQAAASAGIPGAVCCAP